MKLKKLIGLLVIVGLLSAAAMTISAKAASKLSRLDNTKDRSLKRIWWVNWRWSEAECRFYPKRCVSKLTLRKDECHYHPPVPDRMFPPTPKKRLSSQSKNAADHGKPINPSR